MRVRRTTARDADACAALYAESFPLSAEGSLDRHTTQRWVDEHPAPYWEAAARESSNVFAVAEEDPAGPISGFVLWRPAGDRLIELDRLFVAPSRRGSGVGTVLLEQTRGWIPPSFDEAELWVLPGNASAKRFYARHGWQATRDTRSKALDDGRVITWDRWVRRLRGGHAD